MKYYKLLNNDGYDQKEFIVSRIYPEDFKINSFDRSIEEINEEYPEDWEQVSEEEYIKQEGELKESETTNVKHYYKGKNSLYQFAEEHELNSYEFDIIKRIVRCRFKGNWLDDLEKTKGVIDIYIKERKEKYNAVLPR